MNKNQWGAFFETDKHLIFFSNKKSSDFISKFKKPVVFSHQVHGTNIISLNKLFKYSFSTTKEADGIKLDQKNLGAGLQTADCVPCFVIDSNKITALHLGWKGLAKGLLEKALRNYSEKDALKVFIGPHIMIDSFETDSDVYDAFKDSMGNNKNWYYKKNNKFHISLEEIIREKLKVYSTEIISTKIDTLTSEDYFSYRRGTSTKTLTKGRNISFALMKDSPEKLLNF